MARDIDHVVNAASDPVIAILVATAAVTGSATKRFTAAEEIADLVLLLAGDRATNITGEDIIIDGGLTQSL